MNAAAKTDAEALRAKVIAALHGIYDPEIPVNVYDLGLIYTLDIDAGAPAIRITMTLTAPGCPVAQTFPGTVECAVREATGITDVAVTLTFDPPWSRERMSEAAQLQLGML